MGKSRHESHYESYGGVAHRGRLELNGWVDAKVENVLEMKRCRDEWGVYPIDPRRFHAVGG